MRLYLDDDIASRALVRLLRGSGHDVFVPAEVGGAGRADAIHLTHAIRDSRAILTANHSDFEDLHYLIKEARGHHAGILVIRSDNDPHRDMTPRGVSTAIKNIEAASIPLGDQVQIVNHWR